MKGKRLPSRKPQSIALLSVAIAIAAIAFLPWSAWLGEMRPEELIAYRAVVRKWLIWMPLVVGLGALLAVLRGDELDEVYERGRGGLVAVPARNFALVVGIAMFLVAALLSRVLFAHNPHLVDTIAQLFQARIFAAGALTAPAPADIEFFAASQTVEHAGRWFSQYPPGHPALLTVGLVFGIPWLVNPLFAGGTVVMVYAAGRRLLGEGSGKLAALLYSLSPFALLMSASYMNHVTTGFFLASSLYATARAIDDDGYAWPAAAGASLAFAMMIRPLESGAWAVVLGSWIFLRRGVRPALATTVVSLACLTPLFAYNAATTGHPLRFGYTLLWGSGHGLGFHTDPWGEPFSPLVSFANTALDFQRLNDLLLGWPFPSLLFLLAAIVWAARTVPVRRAVGPLVLLLLAAPVAYFFYWHRDNYLGPRFLFASLVPAVLLTAAGIAAIDRWSPRWRPAYRSVLLFAVVFGLAVTLPENAGIISGLEPEMKLHPEAQTEELGIEDAVVFVKVGWGSRLIGRLWGWQVPASEVERSYRDVDGCRIQQALDAADSLAAAGGDSTSLRQGLRAQLGEWRRASLPVVSGALPDASVRVDTTRELDAICRYEAGLDQTGSTLYETLVWRNDPWLEKGTIYARFLEPERNRRLLARYPDRDAYLYAPLTRERTAVPRLLELKFTEPEEVDSVNVKVESVE